MKEWRDIFITKSLLFFLNWLICFTKYLVKKYFSNKFYKPHYSFLLVICLFYAKFTFSQSGNIFLKNYTPNINNISNMNISIAQDNKGVMYFANPRGILSYDGIRWKLISVPSTPLVLSFIPNNKRMFVGCRKDFGYIDFDKTGKEVYTSLSKKYPNIEGISKIVVTKEYIYFCSSNRLYCYSIRNKTIYQILSPNRKDQFSGFFSNKGKVFVNISSKGLYVVEGNKLCPLNTQILNHIILADIPLTNSSTLLYTEDNNCYTFDGLKLYSFKIEEAKYLKENVVTAGLEYSKDLFVLATLSGGKSVV